MTYEPQANREQDPAEENHAGQTWQNTQIDSQRIELLVRRIKSQIHRYVVGQEKMVEQLLVALITGGHVLIEGVPGIAKTLTTKLLAKSINTQFSRIQFTPDLMPTDIIGTSVYNLKNSEFNFVSGPIFSNLVLIDEINRAPAKTQAALFEVMEERQVTVDGKTYPMEEPFFVMATQNPIEQEGTYRLPEAQLDRFLFRIKIHYPELHEEKQILERFKNQFQPNLAAFEAVVESGEIAQCRKMAERVFVKQDLIDYIAEIVYQTRHNGSLYLGASPRASLAILRSAKTLAAMRGRDFVTPDDIQEMAYPVLNHRIILSPEKEMEGLQSEDIIKQIIQKIEVPR
jgi:MoxR-like ATPase